MTTDFPPSLDELIAEIQGREVQVRTAPLGQPNRFDERRLQQRQQERERKEAEKAYRRLSSKPASSEVRKWLRGRLMDLVKQIDASQVGNPEPLGHTLNLARGELRELLAMLDGAEKCFADAVALAVDHAIEHRRFPKIMARAWILQPEDLEGDETGASSGEELLPLG
jgi:hypothetical protein